MKKGQRIIELWTNKDLPMFKGILRNYFDANICNAYEITLHKDYIAATDGKTIRYFPIYNVLAYTLEDLSE